MRQPSGVLVAVLVLALAVATGACKKPPETVPEADQGAEASRPVDTEAISEPTKEVTEPFARQPVEPPRAAPEPTIDELNRQGVLSIVYFEYDSSDLSEQARRTLQANAQWLKDNPRRSIVIEGHCDERGTIEYNITLGDRRANAVRDYLVGLGVNGTRMRSVSYGEERPVDPGHSEAAWSKNRRAEFLIES